MRISLCKEFSSHFKGYNEYHLEIAKKYDIITKIIYNIVCKSPSSVQKEVAWQCEQFEKIPAFLALHIPAEEFEKTEIYKEYTNPSREGYTIGIDVPQKNDDFGFKLEPHDTVKTPSDFLDTLKNVMLTESLPVITITHTPAYPIRE